MRATSSCVLSMLCMNSDFHLTNVLPGGRGQTDYNIGQIVKKLDATGDLKMETAVVVFGDHGARHCSSHYFNVAPPSLALLSALSLALQAISWESMPRGARSVSTVLRSYTPAYFRKICSREPIQISQTCVVSDLRRPDFANR